MDREKIEKDLLENMEKATKNLDSRDMIDKVTSNEDHDQKHCFSEDRDKTVVKTLHESDGSSEGWKRASERKMIGLVQEQRVKWEDPC